MNNSSCQINNQKFIYLQLKMSIKLEKVSKFKKQEYRIEKNKQNYQKKLQEYPTREIEYDPFFIYQQLYQSSPIQDPNYSKRQFQDAYLTQFISQQILLIRETMMGFGLFSIFLSICFKALTIIQNQILILQSLISLILVILSIIKFIKVQFLKEKQLIRQKQDKLFSKFIKQNFIQVFILIFHPNILTKDVIVFIKQPVFGQMSQFHINNFFQIVMQTRIYLFLMAMIYSSLYCNTRANRLCRIYSTKNYLVFAVKSLFQYNPLTFLIMLYVSLVVVYAQMMTLSERQIQPCFANFINSIWFVIITMGTVGYGDYTPYTYLGRFIAFCAAISGIIISSLLILTLSRYLSMQNGQKKAHITLKRLQLRKILQKYSRETILFTSRLIRADRKDQEKSIQNLKKKAQKVKFTIRQIKNMIDNDNLSEQINRLFQCLYQNLNDIYKNQESYAKLLLQLYAKQKATINDIQFSFTTEIQNIIKDR